jgi:hypothetical protein
MLKLYKDLRDQCSRNMPFLDSKFTDLNKRWKIRESKVRNNIMDHEVYSLEDEV